MRGVKSFQSPTLIRGSSREGESHDTRCRDMSPLAKTIFLSRKCWVRTQAGDSPARNRRGINVYALIIHLIFPKWWRCRRVLSSESAACFPQPEWTAKVADGSISYLRPLSWAIRAHYCILTRVSTSHYLHVIAIQAISQADSTECCGSHTLEKYSNYEICHFIVAEIILNRVEFL